MSAVVVLLVAVVYMAVVVGIARWADASAWGERLGRHPLVYSLGQLVVVSTWTYLGSVQLAAAGTSVFEIFVGATILFSIGAPLFERVVVRAKQVGATSVADMVAARYGGSEMVAGLATVLLSLSFLPYVGVQLGSLATGFEVLTGTGGVAFCLGVGGVVAFMAARYGLSHLDATEVRPGLMVSVALESLVKLVVFLVLTAILIGAAFESPSDLWASMDAAALRGPGSDRSVASALVFVTVIMSGIAAYFCFPRMFYIAVVQCPDPRYVRTAGRFGVYLFILFHLALIPLAHASVKIVGPDASTEALALSAPLALGRPGLAAFAFVGLMSAAASMLAVEVTALCTMITNHLVVPALRRGQGRRLSDGSLIGVRNAVSVGIVLGGFLFQVSVGRSTFMSAIGLNSLVSMPIVAIPLLVGLYDPRPNRNGALLGMGLGSAAWIYTLIVPVFVRGGVLPQSILQDGLLGISLLRPGALFGLSHLPALTHAMVWIVSFTVGGMVVGRSLWPPSKAERLEAERFVRPERFTEVSAQKGEDVRPLARRILLRLFEPKTAEAILGRALTRAGLERDQDVLGTEALRLRSILERDLAGSIGAAMAHGLMTEGWPPPQLSDRTSVAQEYAQRLVDLNMTPDELVERVDHQTERQELLEEQYASLRRLNDELEHRVTQRTEALTQRNEELRLILDNAGQGFVTVDAEGQMSAERSEVLSRWLEIEGDGSSFIDALSHHDPEMAEWVEAALATLLDPIATPELALSQLPERMKIGSLDLHCQYHPISGREDRALVVISDVSEARRHAEAKARRDEILALLEEAIAQPMELRAFVDEMEALLVEVRQGPDLASACRGLHTFKGNARMRGLSVLAEETHRVESWALAAGELPTEGVTQLIEHWRSNTVFLRRLLDSLQASERSGALELQELVQAVARAESDEEVAEATRRALGFTMASSFYRLAAEARRLAGALGRGPLEVEVEGVDLPVDPAMARPISLGLVHLVRNAVDHGIETPEERRAQGKSETARLRIAAGVESETWWIEVKDDGRGIDTAGLRLQLGDPDLSTTDVLLRLLDDGVSTKKEVTEVSGRGVGLSALRGDIERFGGRIEVHSKAGEGTEFRIVLPRVTPSA